MMGAAAERKEKKKLPKVEDREGPCVGYALPNKKHFYLCNIPTMTGTKLFIDIEKPRGADDLIVGDHYYLIGGYENIKATYAIPLADTAVVLTKAQMNVGRFYSTSTAMDARRIFTIGGRMSEQTLRACERYEIATDRWVLMPSLNIARDCATLGTLDSRFIFALEGRSSGEYVTAIERYDVQEEEAGWVQLNPIRGGEAREPRAASLCVQVNNGDLLIAGGTLWFDGRGYDDVYTFDPRRSLWTQRSIRLPKGCELYPVAALYQQHYYQLSYSYSQPSFDLIIYSLHRGTFTIVPPAQIWRKKSL